MYLWISDKLDILKYHLSLPLTLPFACPLPVSGRSTISAPLTPRYNRAKPIVAPAIKRAEITNNLSQKISTLIRSATLQIEDSPDPLPHGQYLKQRIRIISINSKTPLDPEPVAESYPQAESQGWEESDSVGWGKEEEVEG